MGLPKIPAESGGEAAGGAVSMGEVRGEVRGGLAAMPSSTLSISIGLVGTTLFQGLDFSLFTGILNG